MNDFEKDTSEEIAEVTSESEVQTVSLEKPAEAAPETEEAPKKQYAGHMTASAAALNAEGEVDVRRRKPREEKKIKESKISYERKRVFTVTALLLFGSSA